VNAGLIILSYVLIIVAIVLLTTLLKRPYFGILPILAANIIYFASEDRELFWLIFISIVIYIISLLYKILSDKIDRKMKRTELGKSGIEDL
jgi:hypothetical protein